MTVFAGMPRAQTSSINQNDEGGDVRWLLVFLALPATWWRVSLKHRAVWGGLKCYYLHQSLIVLHVATVWLMAAHIILDCV